MADKRKQVSKLSNKKLIESAIANIEQDTGFHIVNPRYGDGYLVDVKKDCVCWFNIKEIPHYTFGIWTRDLFTPSREEDRDAEIIIFAQHELTFDKFKPSRSSLKTTMYRYNDVVENDVDGKQYWAEFWNNWDVIRMLTFMKKHKYRTYDFQWMSEAEPWDLEHGNLYCFIDYYKDWILHYKGKLKDSFHKKRTIRKIINQLKKLHNSNIVMSDYENWYPSLHVFMYTDEDSLSKKDLDLYNKILDRLEEKYFREADFNYLETKRKFNSFLKAREKNDGDGEKLLWKRILD